MPEDPDTEDVTPVRLPSVPASLARAALRFRRAAGATTQLPDLGCEVPGWVPEPERLAGYRALMGSVAELPLAFPQIALTSMHLGILARREFPVRALGLIHPGFVVEVLHELPAAGPWDLRAWVEGLRHVRSGLELDLCGEVLVGGRPVWRSRAATLSRSRAASGAEESTAPHLSEEVPWDHEDVLPAPEGTGRAFARVSGDVNPIHLHRASARLLGFRRPIAHGWWLAGRTTAALGVDEAIPGRRLEIAFRRPVELPSAPLLRSLRGPSSVDFALVAGSDGVPVPADAPRRPLVLGRVTTR